jgi:hypothetical protein
MMKRMLQTSAVTRGVATRSMAMDHVIQKHQGHIPMSQPLGQGRVIPLKFDYHRPVYIVPAYWKRASCFFLEFQTSIWGNLITVATVVWAVHGGFTGHLPADPHVLWG